jgi:hypothetical protein
MKDIKLTQKDHVNYVMTGSLKKAIAMRKEKPKTKLRKKATKAKPKVTKAKPKATKAATKE